MKREKLCPLKTRLTNNDITEIEKKLNDYYRNAEETESMIQRIYSNQYTNLAVVQIMMGIVVASYGELPQPIFNSVYFVLTTLFTNRTNLISNNTAAGSYIFTALYMCSSYPDLCQSILELCDILSELGYLLS